MMADQSSLHPRLEFFVNSLKSLKNLLSGTALKLWRAMPDRGWPKNLASLFVSPPKWLVALTVVVVLWVGIGLLIRLLVAIPASSAEDINKLLIGLGGVIGVPFLVWRTRIADQQRHIAQEQLYTSLLSKAVEQLGATREEKTYREADQGASVQGDLKPESIVKTVPNLELRLGAIYTLEKVARDYLPLNWQIMEILCAYVRNNARPRSFCSDNVKSAYYKTTSERTEEDTLAILRREREIEPPTVDVQAALTVIGRRSDEQRQFEKRTQLISESSNNFRLDLSNCNLAKVNLKCGHFEHATFVGTSLECALMDQACLQGAILLLSQLQGARCSMTLFDSAVLDCSDLGGARLFNASLKGATLSNAEGLTTEQLGYAVGDSRTILPPGIARPTNWLGREKK